MAPMRSREVPSAASALTRALAQVARSTGSGAALGPVWKDVVGDAIAAHARPVELRAGTLLVRCDAPSWQAELASRAPELIGRLAERLGATTVQRLEFERR